MKTEAYLERAFDYLKPKWGEVVTIACDKDGVASCSVTPVSELPEMRARLEQPESQAAIDTALRHHAQGLLAWIFVRCLSDGRELIQAGFKKQGL